MKLISQTKWDNFQREIFSTYFDLPQADLIEFTFKAVTHLLQKLQENQSRIQLLTIVIENIEKNEKQVITSTQGSASTLVSSIEPTLSSLQIQGISCQPKLHDTCVDKCLSKTGYIFLESQQSVLRKEGKEKETQTECVRALDDSWTNFSNKVLRIIDANENQDKVKKENVEIKEPAFIQSVDLQQSEQQKWITDQTRQTQGLIDLVNINSSEIGVQEQGELLIKNRDENAELMFQIDSIAEEYEETQLKNQDFREKEEQIFQELSKNYKIQSQTSSDVPPPVLIEKPQSETTQKCYIPIFHVQREERVDLDIINEQNPFQAPKLYERPLTQLQSISRDNKRRRYVTSLQESRENQLMSSIAYLQDERSPVQHVDQSAAENTVDQYNTNYFQQSKQSQQEQESKISVIDLDLDETENQSQNQTINRQHQQQQMRPLFNNIGNIESNASDTEQKLKLHEQKTILDKIEQKNKIQDEKLDQKKVQISDKPGKVLDKILNRLSESEDLIVVSPKEKEKESYGQRWMNDERVFLDKLGPDGYKFSQMKQSEKQAEQMIGIMKKQGIYHRLEQTWTPEVTNKFYKTILRHGNKDHRFIANIIGRTKKAVIAKITCLRQIESSKLCSVGKQVQKIVQRQKNEKIFTIREQQDFRSCILEFGKDFGHLQDYIQTRSKLEINYYSNQLKLKLLENPDHPDADLLPYLQVKLRKRDYHFNPKNRKSKALKYQGMLDAEGNKLTPEEREKQYWERYKIKGEESRQKKRRTKEKYALIKAEQRMRAETKMRNKHRLILGRCAPASVKELRVKVKQIMNIDSGVNLRGCKCVVQKHGVGKCLNMTCGCISQGFVCGRYCECRDCFNYEGNEKREVILQEIKLGDEILEKKKQEIMKGNST